MNKERFPKGRGIPSRIKADRSKQAPNNSYSVVEYYEDLAFRCRDCGVECVWTAEQQRLWYEEWGGPIQSTAVRCRECRKKVQQADQKRRTDLGGAEQKRGKAEVKDETYNAVVGLVSEFTGYDSGKIEGTTRLMEDLGVDGDDAAELLQEFAARFKVDFSGFEFERHFGPEAGWNPLAVASYFVGPRLEPVTVERLVQAVERGRWHL